MLKDPSERIFSDKDKDCYLPLHKLLTVNYKYKYVDDMLESLNKEHFCNLVQLEL